MSDRAGDAPFHMPCLNMWGECPQGSDSHVCDRPTDHEGRCRCGMCDATTTRIDPIFQDPEELELHQEALDAD